MKIFLLSLVAAILLTVPAHGGYWVSADGIAGWGGGHDDSFGFSFTMLDWHGGAIVARVTTDKPLPSDSKAGVMMRASLDPGAAMVALNTRSDGSIEFLSRNTIGAVATVTPQGSGTLRPTWLKLISAGGTRVEGWTSLDGAVWQMVGMVQVPKTFIWVGTAASVGTPATLIDSVAITGVGPTNDGNFPKLPSVPTFFVALP